MKPFKDVFKCDSITLDLTNKCNLSCVYCFEHDKNKDVMPKETAIKAVNLAYESMPDRKNPLLINFFGGEPLLNWEAMKAVIDHCDKNKYKVSYGITTNLTILTDEMIEYFDDYSIPLLISIDGIKKVHDRNRCNSYDIVRKNIQRLIDAGLGIYIEARMTIMPNDIRYAYAGVKELFEMGISNICPIPVYDTFWDSNQLILARFFYYFITEFFIDVLKDPNNKRNLSIKYIDDSLMDLVFTHDTENDTRCPVFRNTWCTIDSLGDVYACHQGPTMEKKYKDLFHLGNLDSIDENKLYSASLSQIQYKREECDTCTARGLCKSGCPAENLRQNRDSSIPTDAFCELQRIIWSNARQFKDKLLSLENVRNRRLSIIRENLKVMEYADQIFTKCDLNDDITLVMQLTHLQDLLTNIDDIIQPRVKEDITNKLAIILSYIATKKNKTLQPTQEEVTKVCIQ